METSLRKSLDKIGERINVGDTYGAMEIVKVLKARVDDPRTEMGFVERVLYERLDDWTDIKQGTVHVRTMLEILQEIGALA